jgi:hypothetical protein
MTKRTALMIEMILPFVLLGLVIASLLVLQPSALQQFCSVRQASVSSDLSFTRNRRQGSSSSSSSRVKTDIKTSIWSR